VDAARDQFVADVAVKLDRITRRLDEIERLAKDVEKAASNPRNELWQVVSQAEAGVAELRNAHAEVLAAHREVHKRLEQIAGHDAGIWGLRQDVDKLLGKATEVSEATDALDSEQRKILQALNRLDAESKRQKWRGLVLAFLAGLVIAATYLVKK
jgi:phage shock protein A